MSFCRHSQSADHCPLCIREDRIAMLESFVREAGADVAEDGSIWVTCQSCNPPRCNCHCHMFSGYCSKCTALNRFDCTTELFCKLCLGTKEIPWVPRKGES